MAIKSKTIFAAVVEDVKGTLETDAATDAIGIIDFSLKPEIAQIARKIMTDSLTPLDPLMGKQNAGFSVTVELKGSGVHGTVPEAAALFEVCFGKQTIIGDGTVKATPTPTQTAFTVSGTEEIHKGDLILVKIDDAYQTAWVTSATAGTAEVALVVSGLSEAPASAAVVKGSVMYNLLSSGHKSLSAYFYLDGDIKFSFAGCQGTCKLSGFEVGAAPKAEFSMEALSWAVESAACGYTPTIDRTLKPPVVLGAELNLNGTPEYARSVDLDLGIKVSRREAMQAISGTHALDVSERDTKGSFDPYLENLNHFTAWQALTPAILDVLLADKLAAPNLIGLRLPKILRNKVDLADKDNVWTQKIAFSCHGDGDDEVALAFAKTPSAA